MYHQINATEMFRERQIALLEEAEDLRLARRLRVAKRSTQEKGVGHLRRAAFLSAAVAVLLFTVAGAAFAADPPPPPLRITDVSPDGGFTGISTTPNILIFFDGASAFRCL